MPDLAPRRRAIRDGIVAAAPMLIGVVPFGLVAGAATVAAGFGFGEAMGLSALVFAGASQLAIVEALDDGASIGVAVVTALTINLRMLLYSASLAPLLAVEPLRRRLSAAYFLVDQAYALSIVRWTGGDDERLRLPFYFGVGGLLSTCWLASTAVGAAVGRQVPGDVPLEFAIPLVFLVLLVPVLDRRPAYVAAAVGGVSAVLAAELGAERVSILVGGVAGIVAGAVADRPSAGTGAAAAEEGAT